METSIMGLGFRIEREGLEHFPSFGSFTELGGRERMLRSCEDCWSPCSGFTGIALRHAHTARLNTPKYNNLNFREAFTWAFPTVNCLPFEGASAFTRSSELRP